jgi:uncharacterized protein with FMN-binding domain
MNRPALATAGTILGLILLIGGKAATSAGPLALPGTANVALAPTAQGTLTGTRIDTRYGPVQVRVTIKRGRLVDVQTLALPTGGKSGSIADYSAPILRKEALAAQGAGIHAVSGATYTSEGYARSLQAALDQLPNKASQSSQAAAPAARGSVQASGGGSA